MLLNITAPANDANATKISMMFKDSRIKTTVDVTNEFAVEYMINFNSSHLPTS